MKVMKERKRIKMPMPQHTPSSDTPNLEKVIANSWALVAPFWPLKNLIAVNPIAGFEKLPFEEGLKQAKAYFQQKELPQEMLKVNIESIKWLQAFFDEGQATIRMPNRHLGFLKSTLSLLNFDQRLHKNDKQKLGWLHKLPNSAEAIINEALGFLGINSDDWELFLSLMLTTLPGWAAHIQYLTSWASPQDIPPLHKVTQKEYLAFRLILTALLWPEAKQLLNWHLQAVKNADVTALCQEISSDEKVYQTSLFKRTQSVSKPSEAKRAKAQLVFCIDVRSEPFRRALEMEGAFETYGFAGFFGVPVTIGNAVTHETHSSCPVLLKPAHKVVEHPNCSHQSCQKGYSRAQGIKKLYQSMKYTFTTPFSLVETIGLINGLWMGLRSLLPNFASSLESKIKHSIAKDYSLTPDIQSIPLEQQTAYGAGALKMMGMTENFAPLVVFCGHGSTTQNNAYATALDCGACGGRHGAPNARILAAILNRAEVKKALFKQGLVIPEDTLFIAAEHNTTTDAVEIFVGHVCPEKQKQIQELKQALKKAQDTNSLWRAHEMGVKTDMAGAKKATATRAKDWAQVRPEWGLARNAAFIVGPRWLTKDINLEGRSFLHSYDWEKDHEGALLTTILTAPMVVAQWINAQYFFSTMDNVAFGAGSKVTKNITGKIGVMQGNASDLMHGLPLQSVLKSDKQAYHKPLRLSVFVYAPKGRIHKIVYEHAILQKLFGNGWIHMICFDPEENQKFQLTRELSWEIC